MIPTKDNQKARLTHPEATDKAKAMEAKKEFTTGFVKF